jgi:hypothetical protein
MKTFLIICALAFHSLCIGQIKRTETIEYFKIGEFKSGPLNATLKYSIFQKDTVYHLLFQNAQYKTLVDIKSFVFLEVGHTLDTLFNLFSEALTMDKGKKMNFQLGEDNITVVSNATMGVKFIDILRPADGAYLTLTQRQLKKLFNHK